MKEYVESWMYPRIQAARRKFGRRNCIATEQWQGGVVLGMELLLILDSVPALLFLSLKKKVYDDVKLNEQQQG